MREEVATRGMRWRREEVEEELSKDCQTRPEWANTAAAKQTNKELSLLPPPAAPAIRGGPAHIRGGPVRRE